MRPLICISYGGSHLQIGIIHDNGYSGHPPIDWRADLHHVSNPDARDLTHVAHQSLLDLLSSEDLSEFDEFSLGIAFPGPERGGQWFSNNLTDDFKNGVDLPELTKSVFEENGIHLKAITCVLDAQADAGAEVYHPQGALHSDCSMPATVINFATGIAAGLVTPVFSSIKGRVLSSDHNFARELGKNYDNGAGHIGRHILFSPVDGSCVYNFEKDGRTAQAPGRVRLSEYLSGPALVSRFELLKISDSSVATDSLKMGGSGLGHRSSEDFLGSLVKSNQRVREVGGFAVRNLMNTLNEAETGESNPQHKKAHIFREMLVRDFVNLFELLNSLDGWSKFGSLFVATGGIGQNIFSSRVPDFFEEISGRTSGKIEVRRSTLSDGCERAAHYFFALTTSQ